MTISKNTLLIGFTLCSALAISGCDKSDTDSTANNAENQTETAGEITPDATATVNSATDEAASISSINNADSVTLAQMLASTTVTAFFMPFTMSGDLTDEQKTCLKARDANLGVAEAKSFLQQHLTNDEIQSIDDFYQTDTGRRVNQYSQEQMAIASGETVDSPMGELTAEDMAEMDKYAQQPAFQKLASIDENTSGNQLMEALTPVINSELKRCGIDIAL